MAKKIKKQDIIVNIPVMHITQIFLLGDNTVVLTGLADLTNEISGCSLLCDLNCIEQLIPMLEKEPAQLLKNICLASSQINKLIDIPVSDFLEQDGIYIKNTIIVGREFFPESRPEFENTRFFHIEDLLPKPSMP